MASKTATEWVDLGKRPHGLPRLTWKQVVGTPLFAENDLTPGSRSQGGHITVIYTSAFWLRAVSPIPTPQKSNTMPVSG